jgi:hypothetical protein
MSPGLAEWVEGRGQTEDGRSLAPETGEEVGGEDVCASFRRLEAARSDAPDLNKGQELRLHAAN